MNQFTFGWNRDETLGGDLVFLDIVEASENASSMDNSQAGFQTDNLIALKVSADKKCVGWKKQFENPSQLFVHTSDNEMKLKQASSQSAWTLIDIKFENDFKEIGLTRSLQYFCDDPFEINAEAIRMMFATYNNAIQTSTQRTDTITIPGDSVQERNPRTTPSVG